MSEVPIFEPVDPDGSQTEASAQQEDGREASRSAAEEYPLAGPILDEARDTVLKGRCGECDSRLKVRVEDPQAGAVRVRCPICSNTRRIQL